MSQVPTAGIAFDLPSRSGQVQGFFVPMQGNVTPALEEEPTCDEEICCERIDAANHAADFVATPSSYFSIKKLIEFFLTIGLLVVGIPIMVTVACLILITQGRPIFYRQTRVGKSGELFRIWKFRSMRCDAESETGATWSGSDDPRVTVIGRWLRCSHIDELPQLINVLCGDMSLIGPRPERPEFVSELARELPSYMERLRVRPGITGLAQLELGYDHCVSDVKHKVELDIHYINTASLRGDGWLLLATIPYVAQELIQKYLGDRRGQQSLTENTQETKSIEGLVTVHSITNSTPQSLDRECAA